jgi:hypothetical protein
LTSRTRLGRKSHLNICATLGIWVGRVRRARNTRSTSRTRSRRKSHLGRPQNPFGEPLLTKSTKKHTFVECPRRALDASGRVRFGRTRVRGVRGRSGCIRRPIWHISFAQESQKQTFPSSPLKVYRTTFSEHAFSKIGQKKTEAGAGVQTPQVTSSNHGLQHTKKSQNSVCANSGNSLLKKKLVPILTMGPETGGSLDK